MATQRLGLSRVAWALALALAPEELSREDEATCAGNCFASG
jgi:hypothetical protein